MRASLTLIVIMAVIVSSKAQTDPQYRAELGVGVGLTAYEGDFNGSVLKGMKPSATLLARYKFNPRTGLALNIGYGKIGGSSDNANTWFPQYNDTTVTFSSTIVDAGLRFECNFWPYGTGKEYRGAVRLTPYIALGIGMTYAKTGDINVFTTNVPIGLGVKYKVATRVNLNLEWAIHFTMSDKLDGIKDPYGIESSGIFKNTDCYSTLRLSLTYDIWAKCKTCNNDKN